jgi:hypothetical protein
VKLIIVVGRGHSGTRAVAHTLIASGVFMGNRLNAYGDLIPAEPMYAAARLVAQQVQYVGEYHWNFCKLHHMCVAPEFKRLVHEYLRPVLQSDAIYRGWKLPETTLVYPWIARMFPEAYYIFWIRDPRDCILGRHLTDELKDFGIVYGSVDDPIIRRAVSWKYQMDIINATQPPERHLWIRFEDFILEQEKTVERLEEFLKMRIATISANPQAVGRWKTVHGFRTPAFLESYLAKYGYH